MEDVRVPRPALEKFVEALLLRLGCTAEEAETTANAMVWSDYVGRYNHGVNRLPALAARVKTGVLTTGATPELEIRSPGTAIIDGRDGFGQYVSVCACDQAIKMAKSVGISAVGVRNSNHFGVGAFFVQRLAAAGMVGLALSNSFPKVAAHGGFHPIFGTNPIAFGIPRLDGRSLLFDISTAGLAGSTVLEHQANGTPIPEGYLVDETGQPVTDPAKAGSATLLPAAGALGYGLALMAELLCGALTGGAMAKEVRSMYNDFTGPARTGHFFVAIDIKQFMPLDAFEARVEGLIQLLKATDEGVRIPGEQRWETAESHEMNGIPISPKVREGLENVALGLGVSAPWPTTNSSEDGPVSGP